MDFDVAQRLHVLDAKIAKSVRESGDGVTIVEAFRSASKIGAVGQPLRSMAGTIADWTGTPRTFGGGGTQYFAPNNTPFRWVPGQ